MDMDLKAASDEQLEEAKQALDLRVVALRAGMAGIAAEQNERLVMAEFVRRGGDIESLKRLDEQASQSVDVPAVESTAEVPGS